jgi:hypothetical protein
MARPNRTDRRLYWTIELFKTMWTTTLAAGGAGITLAVAEIGGWAMGFIIIIGAISLAISVAAAWIGIETIRKLPND